MLLSTFCRSTNLNIRKIQCSRIFIRALCSETKTEDNKQIYYGTLTPQIRAVKVFSLTTSICGILAQPFLISQVDNVGAPILIGVCTFVGFFTFCTPWLLHYITSRYVTHLNYNSKEDIYKAITLSFFLRRKEITFNPSDVFVPSVPGAFTSFVVQRNQDKSNSKPKVVPLLVDPTLFKEPYHYARIMGYDKPIDFKLSVKKETTEDKKSN